MKLVTAALWLIGFSAMAQSSSPLTSVMIGGKNVLANAAGLTVYTFDPDQLNVSNCTASCAQIWPPVVVPAGSTLSAPAATILRADGKVQVTFNGHPLYTYIGDRASGQDNGNGLNGIWHIVTQ
jgi:predicted lipoprotein with Yx(FWY)xxD motif